MKMVDELRSRPLLRKLFRGGLVFLVLFSVTGFFILPPVLKSILIKRLSEQLHREVTIQKIRVNPFMLSLTVKGFVIKEINRPETFFSFDQLYLNLQSMSLIRRGPILSEIRIENPYLNIIRGEDMRYNFSDLLPKSGPQQKPFRFSLNNIQLLNGSVDFLDGPKHTKHTVRDLTLKIPFLSNLPYYMDNYVKPLLVGKFNDRPVSFMGETKPFADSRETSFDILIKDLDIPYYLAYSPFRMNFGVLSGLFDTKARLSFIQYSNKPPQMKLTGDIAFREIHVVDGKGAPLLKLPLFAIAVADAELISRNIHLSRVSIASPEIYFARDMSGKVNVQSLIGQGNQEPPAEVREGEKGETPSFVLRVDETKLDKGMFTFADHFQDSKFQTVFDQVNVQVNHFSTVRDEKTDISLSLRTEADETLTVAGNLSVLPLASEGTVEFKKIALEKYAPYYRENIFFEVKDAELDIKTHYTFMRDEKAPVMRLTGLEAALNSLHLKQKDDRNAFLDIPLLSVRDAEVDFGKKEVLVGRLYSQKGLLDIKRFKDGKWNVGSLIREGEWSLRNLLKKPAAELQKGQKQKSIPERPWQLTIKDVTVEDYRIKFEDAQPSEPVTMLADRIRLKEENLSTVANAKAKVSFSFRINKTGSVSANGSFVRTPVSANLQMNAKAIDIAPFQPYFTDKVKIIVTDGDVSAKGNLVLKDSGEKGVQMSYRGEASLTKFASVDKINADDFLKFDSLYFSKMDIGYKPLRVNIQEVALSDFYSRLIINSDGSLNVQGIVQKEKAANGSAQSTEAQQTADSEKGKKDEKMITVETVTLQNGTINFSDRYIKPNYDANLLEIGGRISGLSSAEDKLADVNLKGKLDNYAPLEISGKINPLRDDLYIDLKADFKDIDLSPVTPYAGRYAGYTIEKGKLTLSLQYLIVKKKLDAQNRVFLDQFTLGDKVDSPDATKLPVKLAIALLKNRKGEIDLNLPVTGQIDDPKFRLGSVIIKILVNILVKAATSPFALLGAIFGGGEELSYLDFDYGSAALNEVGMKKLDTLVKALYDRPSLKFEIEGHVDLEKDKEGLRQYLFHKKIKAQKLKEMVKSGMTAVPVDEVKIEQNEYPKYLKMAYKAEKFPKPRNIIGMAKDLPVPEMEKLMLTHLEIKDDDLRMLASQRALNVKDYILKSKQVEPERVFLVEPKSLQPEKKEKLRDARVDFRLK